VVRPAIERWGISMVEVGLFALKWIIAPFGSLLMLALLAG
jgi:hypothetical protein